MAFRVHGFAPRGLADLPGASDLPCIFVPDFKGCDAFYAWIEPDMLPDEGAGFRFLILVGSAGALIDVGEPWIALPTRFRGTPYGDAIEKWGPIHTAFNNDPVEALATFLRKRFIGVPYVEYLQTHHWQGVREAALKAADYRCQVCYSPDRLNVHHRTYDRRGRELPSDVTVLCADCHGRFHDKLPKE